MIRDLGIVILIAGLNSSIAFSEVLPNKFFGTWSANEKECSDQSDQIEIRRNNGTAAVSGGSFDTVCTWSDGHLIATETSTSKISGITSDMIVYLVKEQCEKIDRPGASVITYVRSVGQPIYETLYIGSALDAYAGFYRRCKK
jgi:hypothetical protein